MTISALRITSRNFSGATPDRQLILGGMTPTLWASSGRKIHLFPIAFNENYIDLGEDIPLFPGTNMGNGHEVINAEPKVVASSMAMSIIRSRRSLRLSRRTTSSDSATKVPLPGDKLTGLDVPDHEGHADSVGLTLSCWARLLSVGILLPGKQTPFFINSFIRFCT